jgi:putative ABC transport system permease protein
MLLNIIKRSFGNQKKAMVLMLAAVAAGTSVAASLIALSLDIESRVSTELRSFGANIVVEPAISGIADIVGQKRFLKETDIIKSKTIFWRHNIVGVMPVLLLHDPVLNAKVLGTWYKHTMNIAGDDDFVAGAASVMPWWSIEGKWPDITNEVLVGISLSEKLGKKVHDTVSVMGYDMRISGIIRTGGEEDDMVIGPLSLVQRISGHQGDISKVFVSALTTPMDAFAYKDPKTMTKKEYEKWYCTGYVTSIAKQVEEVFIGSTAKPIWPVAETEGKVLNRLKFLVYLLTAVSLIAAALSVSTTMIMSLLRRTDEIALMKAIGADRLKTITIFLTEALVIGLIGGLIGYLLSFGISEYLGVQVFGIGLKQRAMLFPASLGMAVIIATVGAYLPIRRALLIKPAVILKGE